MLTKRLLTISLLLPLMAISAAAHAGSTITDESYWPNEASQGTQSPSAGLSDFRSALAYDGSVSISQPETNGKSTWDYQGGPKGR
jgi:hypothetical protein